MITNENYELYLFDLAEGNLTAEEVKMVEDFLSLHPELNAELAAYRSAVLEADTNVVYENKEALKRKSGGKLFYLFNPYYSAAALITVVLGAWWVLREPQQPAETQLSLPQQTTAPLAESSKSSQVPQQSEVQTGQQTKQTAQTAQQTEQAKTSITSSVRSEMKLDNEQVLPKINKQNFTAAVASNVEQVTKIDTSVIKKDVVQKQVEEQLQQRLANVISLPIDSAVVLPAEQKGHAEAMQQTIHVAQASVEEPTGIKERMEEKVAGWLSYLSKPTLRIQKVKEDDKTRIRIELENQRLKLMGSMKAEL